MKRDEFCQILLSRFRELDDASRWNFLSCLAIAEAECLTPEEGETEAGTFENWAYTIAEVLFPETIGDLCIAENDEA